VEFALLGTLLVACEGQLMPITSANQRIVLAALLMQPNQLVTADDLIDAIWSGRQPRAARPTMQNYVKRLRFGLGTTGRMRLITLNGGYQFAAEEREIDVARFRSLTKQELATAHRRAWEQASSVLGEALDVWRGPAFSDVPSELLARRYGPGLDELRRQAVEGKISAELHQGHHDMAIAELLPLVDADPLCERLRQLLMLALYRNGRRAAALAAYQDARTALRTDLGLAPGPALRDLHQKILRGERA